MLNFTISDLARITGGRLYGSGALPAGELVTRYADISPGSVFAADGQIYGRYIERINSVYARGAVCCIADRLCEDAAGAFILVDDVNKAIEDIARANRQAFAGKVISVTGSAGKTCTKEMIAAVLAQSKKVIKTKENKNSGNSIPMILSKLNRCHEAAVVETGISEFGEMGHYAGMLRPDMVVFTNIGNAHLENLGSREGVFRAKTEILEHLADSAVIVINGDDDLLCRLKARYDVVAFGTGKDCDVRIENINTPDDGRSCCDITYKNRRINVELPAYGKHLITAAAAAAAVGLLFGLRDDEIKKGILSYSVVGSRSAITDTGIVTLIDDSYNSNPEAVISAVDSLMTLPGRHVCILSDMLELGEHSAELHEEIGEYLRRAGVDLVLACGNDSRYFCNELQDRAVFFNSKAELMEALPKYIKKNDRVLVKASRGMAFEDIAEAIRSGKMFYNQTEQAPLAYVKA